MNFKRCAPYVSLILEQAAMSGSNVLFVFFLGRVFSVPDFAAFSLGFTIFLIALSIYEAVISDPMIVLRGGFGSAQENYISAIWRYHLLILIVSGSVAAALWLTEGPLLVKGAALAMAFNASALTTVFLRRRLHSERATETSAAASLAYLVALILMTAGLYVSETLTPATTPLPFLSGNIAFVCVVRARVPAFTAKRLPGGMLLGHVLYARSAVIYSVFSNLTMNVYPIIFAISDNPQAIASFRLVSMTFTPFFQILGAVQAFILTDFVNRSFSQIDWSTKALLAVVAILPLICALAILPFKEAIATLLFGDRYSELGELVSTAYVGVSLALVLTSCIMWLRANQKLASLRLIGFFSFASALAAASVLIPRYDVLGAFEAYAIANGCSVVIFGIMLFRIHRRQ